MSFITTMEVSQHPIKSGSKKNIRSRDVVSASIMHCDVVRLTKSGAPAQREGRRIAPKLFGAMVHAKKIPMEESITSQASRPERLCPSPGTLQISLVQS